MAERTNANKILDSVPAVNHRAHSGTVGDVGPAFPLPHQIGLGDGRTRMVDDLDAVALALAEDGEFPPVPNHHASVRTVLPRPGKREDAPFDNEDVVARLPDLLHRLCARVLEHLLRLRLVVARGRQGGEGARGTGVGGTAGVGRTLGKYDPAL